MAYVRWTPESDVYIFDHVNGSVTCHGCFLNGPGARISWHGTHGNIDCGSNREATNELLAHLAQHVEAGHKVPAWLFDALAPDKEDA